MPKGEVSRLSNKAVKRLKAEKDEAARLRLPMEDAEAKRILDALRR
jgi:hypothetical protein